MTWQSPPCEHDDPEGCEPGQDDCPRCIEARSAINEMERYAESSWERAQENRIDPEAEADLRLHEFLHPDRYVPLGDAADMSVEIAEAKER